MDLIEVKSILLRNRVVKFISWCERNVKSLGSTIEQSNLLYDFISTIKDIAFVEPKW